jgi:hypothetical protein
MAESYASPEGLGVTGSVISDPARLAYDMQYVWPAVRANPPDPLGRDFHFFMTQRVTITEVVGFREVKLQPVVTMFAQDQWNLPDYPPEYQVLPNAIYMFVNAAGDVRAWSNVGYSTPHYNVDNPTSVYPISYNCPIIKMTSNPIRIYLDKKLVAKYPSGEARTRQALSPCYPGGKNIIGWGGLSSVSPANPSVLKTNSASDAFLQNRLSFIEPNDNNLHVAVNTLHPILAYRTNSEAVYVLASSGVDGFLAGSREAQIYFDTHGVVKFSSSGGKARVDWSGSASWEQHIVLDGKDVFKVLYLEVAYVGATFA